MYNYSKRRGVAAGEKRQPVHLSQHTGDESGSGDEKLFAISLQLSALILDT
jgi:hypothetical protein